MDQHIVNQLHDLKWSVEKMVEKLQGIASAQAEMEGMKAENTQRANLGQSVAYDEKAFFKLQEQIRNL